MRSDRVGFIMRLSRVLPWAVATNWTPRSAMVRAAAASRSVPISSMTMTSGIWFSTASIITPSCCAGEGTCIRRARPMAGCGTSPSPAISLEVSTMMTRLWASTDSTRAISRSMVVLPTPGRPSSSRFLPERAKSSMSLMVPNTARPTRQVRPMTRPRRLRMAEMRCSVRSRPARLSPPNSPRRSMAACKSASSTSRCESSASPLMNRASGARPKSSTTSSSSSRSSRCRNAEATRWGSTSSTFSNSSRVVSSAVVKLRLRRGQTSGGYHCAMS